ncbi:MAG TPA: hypothetical protein PK971_05625, partial [Saprospiraceae bacterium]|nr:hypothetical protein [Saprospiraceae bacterium]HND87782.1 hypothetical protein [Saprospiraceae bacterium]
RTQKSPRLIQKSTTQNSTNYLYRTLRIQSNTSCHAESIGRSIWECSPKQAFSSDASLRSA